MAGAYFDIYQTESGYVAVTNQVRRTILSALGKKQRQLPELVRITKKAKPTLSSVHMRQLLSTKLIEEATHPADSRKKIYRLKAKRIGTSHLPIEQLRTAVTRYVGDTSAACVPVSAAFDAIRAAPKSAGMETLRAQAKRLGELASGTFPRASLRGAITALAELLEKDGIARPLKLDLQSHRLELELDSAYATDSTRMANLTASFVHGILDATGIPSTVRVVTQKGRRFTLALGGA